jgi:hypothetical protein
VLTRFHHNVYNIQSVISATSIPISAISVLISAISVLISAISVPISAIPVAISATSAIFAIFIILKTSVIPALNTY